MELKDSKKEKLSYNQVLFGAITNLKIQGRYQKMLLCDKLRLQCLGDRKQKCANCADR